MGFNCLKATEPLRGSSLLFSTKIPDIPDAHLVDLGSMKVSVKPLSCFEHGSPGLGIQHLGDPVFINTLTEPLVFIKS